MSKENLLLCLATLDLSGGSTLRPFIPLIAEHLGASTLEIGFIASFYACIQIAFAPIIGTFSDNIGRKTLLALSFLLSSFTPLLVLLIHTFGYSYHFLFISIIPMAIFRHSQACIKSIIIDRSKATNDGKNPDKTLNIMAQWSCACYIGTTLGPLLVSLIAKESITIVCILSMALFVSAFILTLVGVNDDKNTTFKVKSKQISLNIFRIKYPNKQIQNLIFYHFVAYFALHLYRAGFVLILKHRFELDMNHLAKVLSYKGMIGFGMQLYLSQCKQMTYDAHDLLWKSTLCLSIAMISYGFVHEIHYVYVILIFQECGQSMFRTSFQTVFAHNISKLNSNATQTYIGVLDSLSSFNRSVAPIVFGIVPEQFRYSVVPIVAGMLDLFLFVAQTPKHLKKRIMLSRCVIDM
eukprot:496622_1